MTAVQWTPAWGLWRSLDRMPPQHAWQKKLLLRCHMFPHAVKSTPELTSTPATMRALGEMASQFPQQHAGMVSRKTVILAVCAGWEHH